MNNHHTIEEKVMKEIKKGSVKLRSRYLFLVEKCGMGSALTLSVLLAILVCSLVLLYLTSSDNLGYLTFGNSGVSAFLESFPFLLMAMLVLLMFIAGILIKKSDISYKRPFGYYALGLVGIVVVAGVLVSATSIDERIEDEAYGTHVPGILFRPFLMQGVDDRQRGVVGRVIEVGDGYIRIQTPQTVKEVDVRTLQTRMSEPLIEGLFVMAIGEGNADAFTAKDIRTIGSMDMPMIRRGVHRHFGFFMGFPIKPEDEVCLRDCIQEQTDRQKCRELCLNSILK